MKNAEDERARLEKERIDQEKALRRLERLQQAIPEMGVLASLQEQLHAMGEVTLLPPDFSERYQQASRDLREAGLQLDKDLGPSLIERFFPLVQLIHAGTAFGEDLFPGSCRIGPGADRPGKDRPGKAEGAAG